MNDEPVLNVVLVGHCGPDEWMLRSAISRALPDIELHTVNDQAGLGLHQNPNSLLLINRKLDGDFSVALAADMIPDAVASGARVMLISNFDDAQDAAVSAGAYRGFGKSDVNATATADLLRTVVQRPTDLS